MREERVPGDRASFPPFSSHSPFMCVSPLEIEIKR